MRRLLYILPFLFISCQDSEFFIDYRLKKHYNSFKAEASSRGVSITDASLMFLIKPNLELNGKSVWGLTDQNTLQTYVYIDSAFFETEPDLVEIVVFHELGHARLDRRHTGEYSIMNPTVTHTEWPKDPEDKKKLIDELFHGANR